MADDIVTRLRDYLAIVDHAFVWNELSDAADEIERLRTMAKALYEETKRCGSKHDVKATNDWEEYEMAVRDDA